MSAPGAPSPELKSNRRGLWLRVAGTLLTLALLAVLVQQQGWTEIGAAVRKVAPWRLWLALGVILVSRCATALRWHMLLREVDGRANLGDSLRITFAGLFAANFLPTTIGGDVVRLAACLQLRMDAALAAASLVTDRLIGMAGMALVLPWGLARVAQVGLPALTSSPQASSPLAAAGLFARLKEQGLGFIRRILANFQVWARKPRALFLGLLFTLVHQTCLYVTIHLMLEGMGEPIGWLRIAGIWSLVYFITLLPVSINGYGLQEVSTTLLYAHLGGISLEAAAAVALLQRVTQMAASLPGIFFAPGIIAASRKSRQEVQP